MGLSGLSAAVHLRPYFADKLDCWAELFVSRKAGIVADSRDSGGLPTPATPANRVRHCVQMSEASAAR